MNDYSCILSLCDDKMLNVIIIILYVIISVIDIIYVVVVILSNILQRSVVTS